MNKEKNGLIMLAGAGPGDPELATLGLLRRLKEADTIVYDYLANEALLAHAPQAKAICVGKRAGAHSWKQEDINALLVKLGRQGKRVLRLKGGDPFVFGRGGEEALAVREAGIPFEVVPGVTSGVAALAYAGIPFTHRGLATAAVFVTGQEKTGKPLSMKTLRDLAKLDSTLVFYMATSQAGRISKALIQFGRKAATPAALVHQGTLPGQRVILSTLKDLPEEMRKSGLGAPGLIVIGKVAALRRDLRWFEDRALHGKRVLVTRAREQASRLSEGLRALGAEVLEAPAVRTQALPVDSKMKAALGRLRGARWVVLSSSNGADCLAGALKQSGLDARALAGAKIACIGSATAEALARHGLGADLIPKSFVAEGLADELLSRDSNGLRGARVVLARAKEGRDVLPARLRAAGALVEELPLYRTVPDHASAKAVEAAVRAGGLDWVTFTSSSTVGNLDGQLSPAARALAKRSMLAMAMGPITAKTAMEAGWRVALVSPQATIHDFLKAMEAYARSGS